MISPEEIAQKKALLARLKRRIASRTNARSVKSLSHRHFDPELANIHTQLAVNSVGESVDDSSDILMEGYNFSLYWAQKAVNDDKLDTAKKHLVAAFKARMKMKEFNIEKNKARLAKEMELRKVTGMSELQ